MLFQSLLIAAAFVPSVFSCPEHNNFRRSPHLGRRADPTDGTNSTKNDWAYEASFNWGRVNPAYSLCTQFISRSTSILGMTLTKSRPNWNSAVSHRPVHEQWIVSQPRPKIQL